MLGAFVLNDGMIASKFTSTSWCHSYCEVRSCCHVRDAPLLQVTPAGAKQAPEAFLHESEGSDNDYSDAIVGSAGLPSAPSSPITGAGPNMSPPGHPTPSIAAGDSPTTPMTDTTTDTLPSTASSPSTGGGQRHVLAGHIDSTLMTDQQGCDLPEEQHLPGPAAAGAGPHTPTQNQQGSEGSAAVAGPQRRCAMAVSAVVDAPAVSGCVPLVAAPVSGPSSDEVTGEAESTKATLVEAMPASALLLRSGSAELPLLDAEDLGVELKQRSNSVQVRFAWRLPQWQGPCQRRVRMGALCMLGFQSAAGPQIATCRGSHSGMK